MKIFTKKKLQEKKTTTDRILKHLKRFDPKHHDQIINGNFKSVMTWNLLQEILFFDDNVEESISYLMIKYGIDFNFRTKKGVSFFHLYMILLFYQESYRTKQRLDFFLKLLNYGFLSDHLMIFNFHKMYSLIDVLCILQYGKSVIPKSFFPKQIITEYKKLPQAWFSELYMTLLCQDGRFFSYEKLLNDNLTHTTVFHIDSNSSSYLVNYCLHQFNLPLSTKIDFIFPSCLYLFSNFDDYEKWIENQNSFPIGINEQDTNYIFVNPEFVNNGELQEHTFFNPIEDKYRFHKTFFRDLIRTKVNPYTRNKIDEQTLQSLIQQCNESIFPISTLEEKKIYFPFLFPKLYHNKLQQKNKSLISFIESFFHVNHPYNQIYKIERFKEYEIKYLSHVLLKETNLFPSFQKSFDNPTINTLLKVLLDSCRRQTKYLNIIYYFLEEILQDLNCYIKISPLIDSFEENYPKILDIYLSRFNVSNTHYFNKFIRNIFLIKKFHDET